jgi:hypothetical protein
VREIELARNSCLHNEGVPETNYKQQTNCRLIGEQDKILITPQMLETFLVELAEFAKDAACKMKAVRDTQKTGPLP